MSYIQTTLRHELESWRQEHVSAMKCRDLEDAISRHLHLASLVEKHREDGTWKTVSGAFQYWDILRLMQEMTRALMDLTAEQNASGFTVDGSEELSEYHETICVCVKNADASLKSLQAFKDGKATTLQEVMDGHCIPRGESQSEDQ